MASAVETLQSIVAEMSGGKIDLSKDTPWRPSSAHQPWLRTTSASSATAPCAPCRWKTRNCASASASANPDQSGHRGRGEIGRSPLHPAALAPVPYAVQAVSSQRDKTFHPRSIRLPTPLYLQNLHRPRRPDPRVLAQFGDSPVPRMSRQPGLQPGLRELMAAYGRDVIGLQMPKATSRSWTTRKIRMPCKPSAESSSRSATIEKRRSH